MTLSWREAASRSKSSPEREKGERVMGVKTRDEQGQIGVKEDRECRACTQWTERKSGKDALRQGGW